MKIIIYYKNVSDNTDYIGFPLNSFRYGWMDGWLGFNGILSTQVVAISCLRKFKVC